VSIGGAQVTELPSYRTILFATDGSEPAALAERHALALALRMDARIAALYVIDRHLAFQMGLYAPAALDELQQDGRRALDEFVQRARQVGVAAETHFIEGRPGPTIIGEAERLGADLLVVGSHGQGALADVLLGSVSLYVVHHSHIPVCIVRPPHP
jgi:nucleotide-binding universal stress UspA family protein